jgi:hypothetical protein
VLQVIKSMFGFIEVVPRPGEKSRHRLVIATALANLLMVRKRVLRLQAALCPKLTECPASAFEANPPRRANPARPAPFLLRGGLAIALVRLIQTFPTHVGAVRQNALCRAALRAQVLSPDDRRHDLNDTRCDMCQQTKQNLAADVMLASCFIPGMRSSRPGFSAGSAILVCCDEFTPALRLALTVHPRRSEDAVPVRADLRAWRASHDRCERWDTV